MAEKVYEDADELREDKRKRQLGAMKVISHFGKVLSEESVSLLQY